MISTRDVGTTAAQRLLTWIFPANKPRRTAGERDCRCRNHGDNCARLGKPDLRYEQFFGYDQVRQALTPNGFFAEESRGVPRDVRAIT